MYWLRLVVWGLGLLGLTGCAVQFADPYYGYHDPSKTFKTEGFIAMMNQGGPFVRHPKRPQRWTDLPAYETKACITQPSKKPRALRRLAKELQKQLPEFPPQWAADQTRLYIEVPERSLFYVDADHLRPDAYPTLDQLIQLTIAFPGRVDFVGHADTTGSEPYNVHLSAKRALHLHRYFVLKGLPKVRSHSTGLGERVPRASNASAAGRQKNRRVTLVFCEID